MIKGIMACECTWLTTKHVTFLSAAPTEATLEPRCCRLPTAFAAEEREGRRGRGGEGGGEREGITDRTCELRWNLSLAATMPWPENLQ
jgi:hypothetical protein